MIPNSGVSGFSLIELAIAIFVITLLLGGLLVPLSTQVEQRKFSETQKVLDEIKEALMGYTLANGYLPCPDKTTAAGVGTANDGQEDVNAGTCVALEGNLPWVTLGVIGYDSWGNRFRYRVDAQFSQRVPTFTIATASTTNRVCTTAACTSLLTTISDGPPAVVLSHGKNGYGAINSLTSSANPDPQPPPPSIPPRPDELKNTGNADFVLGTVSANATFVSHPASAAGSVAGEFDDIVVWLSREVLLNRMVAAGRLP